MSKLINEASIPVLLQEMSIDEKAELLVGKSSFSTKAFDKYGIPSILYLDGATGVNIMQYAMEVAGAVLDTPSGDREEKTSSDQSDGTGEPEIPIVRLIRHMISGDEIPAEFPEHEKKIILDYRKRFAAIRPNGEEPNCFPPGMLLGATFEPQDVYEVGKAHHEYSPRSEKRPGFRVVFRGSLFKRGHGSDVQ